MFTPYITVFTPYTKVFNPEAKILIPYTKVFTLIQTYNSKLKSVQCVVHYGITRKSTTLLQRINMHTLNRYTFDAASFAFRQGSCMIQRDDFTRKNKPNSISFTSKFDQQLFYDLFVSWSLLNASFKISALNLVREFGIASI